MGAQQGEPREPQRRPGGGGRTPASARDRRPPDRLRGPTRALSERAAAYAAESGLVDRGERWERRLAEVEAVDAKRRRRARAVAVASWSSSTIAVVVVGWAVLGWRGVLGGIGMIAITAAGTWISRRLAQRRGATAWDWRAQRYRLWGDPSAEVQRLDRPPSQRSTRGR